MTKIPAAKVIGGKIRLPEELMDKLFLNEGDYVLFVVDENNRIYLRKTKKPGSTDEDLNEEIPPPPTFEESAQKQNASPPNMGINNILDAVQDALKDPNVLKMVQDTAKQLSGALGDVFRALDPSTFKATTGKNQTASNTDQAKTGIKNDVTRNGDQKTKKNDEISSDEDDNDEDDNDEDDNDEDEGFKVKID
jgi:antitoxin component of MazEF toxin-antitoxin module